MDIFSPLYPNGANINGLPPLTLPFFVKSGISLSFIVYILIALSTILLFLRINKELIKKILLVAWIITSLLYTIQSGVQVYAENDNKVYGGKSLSELRENTTSDGYYGFLEFSQRVIPPKVPVSLFVSIDPAKHGYFIQKASYYLYPHAIANDANYILIFNADNVTFNQSRNEMNISQEGQIVKTVKNVYLLSVYKEGQYILIKKLN